MKKVKAIIAVILLACVCSCSNNAEIEQLRKENEALKEQITSSTTVETTPTEETSISENTTTVEEVATMESEQSDIWIYDYFKNEFGQNTDYPLILAAVDGSCRGTEFNSYNEVSVTAGVYQAVNNGLLVLFFLIDNNKKAIYYPREDLIVKVLDDDDNIILLNATVDNNYNIYLTDEAEKAMYLNKLLNNRKLTFVLDDNLGTKKCQFELDCSGFAEKYKSATWQFDFNAEYFDINGIPLI